MKLWLVLNAAVLAAAISLSAPSRADTIECAAEVPAGRTGHWYYRIIDGRKCWYQGKPMLPKTSLHWPKDPPVVEADAVTPEIDVRPTTDGRNISSSSAPDPNIWPAPAVDDTSFKSRWQALKPRR